jgi:hypothetical protein
MDKFIRKCKKLFKNGKGHQQLREPQQPDTPVGEDPGPLEAASSLSRPSGCHRGTAAAAAAVRSLRQNRTWALLAHTCTAVAPQGACKDGLRSKHRGSEAV